VGLFPSTCLILGNYGFCMNNKRVACGTEY
jgi:hypothetical protein